jgi:hypothetical protein
MLERRAPYMLTPTWVVLGSVVLIAGVVGGIEEIVSPPPKVITNTVVQKVPVLVPAAPTSQPAAKTCTTTTSTTYTVSIHHPIRHSVRVTCK